MNAETKSFRRWACIALGAVWAATHASAAPRVDFNREVRPLLSDNCFACHGNDTNKLKGGLRLDVRGSAVGAAKSGKHAIVPGKPAESELVRRILTSDADDQMPPGESHKTLAPEQKAMLQRWIAEGAEYRGHWAYEPPVRPAVPAGPDGIDALVRAQLAAQGLQPSPEADRRTLARRLSIDLTGLPATPEEVEAFERDASPDAYGRLVDRWMASPHYGERMAQGWLDVVRFADTIGYHSDNPRNVWPYRDYVIRSFNSNKPFDRFTREQLAGDLLPDAGVESRVGSAFNRLLLTTEEGGAQAKDYEARYLTDRVRAVGAVWLGQTIGCAQCHDHKFDPISSRDFYSMGAFFADVDEAIIGRREDGMLVPDDAQAVELRRRRDAAARLQAEYDGAHPELAGAFGQWQRDQEAAIAGDMRWTRMAPAAATARSGIALKTLDDRSVLATGKNPDTDSYTVRLTNAPAGVVGVRVEALPDDSLPSKGPGRAANGNFVLSEVVARVVKEGADPRKPAWKAAWASFEQTMLADGNPYHAWTAASAIDGDAKGPGPGWAVLPETGRPQQLLLGFAEPLTLAAGESLEIELQQLHGDGGHNLGRFRLSVATDPEAVRSRTALPPAKEIVELLAVPAAARDGEHSRKLHAKFNEAAPELADLRKRLADANKARNDLESTIPRCLVTERNQQPRVVRVLPRGNWMVETGDAVEPALPVFLAGKKAAGKRLDRLDLADWIVSRDNPLTARVVANRVWRQFFGAGLSRVSDDLGAQGEPPTNPGLLDWLACEFRDSGWDTKHLVRTIVTSRTYRQTSVASRGMLARDPYNRELSRQGRWRMEAEEVRDQALAVGGLLAAVVGGPSVRPYQPDGYWENLNFPQRGYDASAGADQYRRGLYTWWQRSFVHPSLLAFDAPTREECVADRGRSNIPQQALVLLNDPTYVEAARAFATRILREGPGDADGRIAWAWRRALARAPLPEERAALRALLDKHLAQFRGDREAAAGYLKTGRAAVPDAFDAAELAAWTDVARALLNLHETITRS